MLYVLYGTDTAKARDKLSSLINTLLSKKKDAMLIRMNSENFEPRAILDHIESQGLFESKSIIVLDTIFSNTTDKEILLDHLEGLQNSHNVFIVLEEKLDKKTLTKIEKHAEKVQVFDLPKKDTKNTSFNIFELSDALGQRDKKKLWVMYQTGKLHNVSDEEMHGILFWGVKNMLLSADANSAKEAALSPFVYNKAKKYASNYTNHELLDLSTLFVGIYHDARRGIKELPTALEELILQLPQPK